jgi:hypothetical protein
MCDTFPHNVSQEVHPWLQTVEDPALSTTVTPPLAPHSSQMLGTEL